MSPQLTVRVVDVYGRPQKGVVVEVHRADPVSFAAKMSLVASAVTDENGYAYFDGLWPYVYLVFGRRERDDFQTNIEKISVVPFQTYEVHLVGSGPPHVFKLIMKTGPLPSGFVEWLWENLESAVEAVYPVEILEIKAADNTVTVRYKVHSPVSGLVIAAVIIAVCFAVAAVFTFLIIKELPAAIPREVWWLLGLAAAGAGLAAFISAIKK